MSSSGITDVSRTIAVAAAALTITGCSEAPEPAATRPSPVITLTGEAEAVPDALVIGTLRLRENCLLVGESVVVFSAGTTWRDLSVLLVDGTVVKVGSHVRMDGGWIEADDIAQAGSPLVPLNKVRACAQRTGATDFLWANAPTEQQGPA